MKPPFSIRFSRSFGEFLLFIVFTIVFFMRKLGLSSGFLKLGCYCSRILIHLLSFSNTRLQQQAMAEITECSKILIRILSFSNTRLQQQAMVGITQRSKILNVVRCHLCPKSGFNLMTRWLFSSIIQLAECIRLAAQPNIRQKRL